MLLVTCIPVSRACYWGGCDSPMPQAWQGALCCGPITDTGRCSPPSLLAGHNGLVAVSTKSGVLPLLHPQGTAGDWEGSALWAREGFGGSVHGAEAPTGPP